MPNEIAPADQRRALPYRLDSGELTPAYEELLANLRKGYPPSLAIDRAGLVRRTAYDHRQRDQAFKDAWDDAYEAGTDNVFVAEASRRAVQGIIKPIFYKGKPVTDAAGNIVEVREYSDRLLEFMLAARRPREFGKKVEVSGPNGEPVRILLAPADMDL